MLIALTNIITGICIVLVTVMGYEYLSVGHGLHPLLAGSVIFSMTLINIMAAWGGIPDHTNPSE